MKTSQWAGACMLAGMFGFFAGWHFRTPYLPRYITLEGQVHPSVHDNTIEPGYVACTDDGGIVVKHIVFDLQQNATQFHDERDLARALQRVLCRVIL